MWQQRCRPVAQGEGNTPGREKIQVWMTSLLPDLEQGVKLGLSISLTSALSTSHPPLGFLSVN